MFRRIVLIESPYSAPTPEGIAEHVSYARRAMRDCIDRGEAPIAGHLLYTQVLDDSVAEERELGIELHLAFHQAKIKTVVYVDYGISPGMSLGIKRADAQSTVVEYRTIGRNAP